MNKFDRYYMGNRDKCEECGEKAAVYDYNGFLVFCTACERAAAEQRAIEEYKCRMYAKYGDYDFTDLEEEYQASIAKEK